MGHKCDPFQLYGQEKDGTVVSTSQNSLLGDNKKFPILAAAGSEKVFDFYPGKITRNVYLLISFPISHHKILPRKLGSVPNVLPGILMKTTVTIPRRLAMTSTGLFARNAPEEILLQIT